MSVYNINEYNQKRDTWENIQDKDMIDYITKENRISSIEIETLNFCNNNCSFCPASREVDKRIKRKMDINLFYKIIDQLAEMGYNGNISLHSNNEPLLDSNIFKYHSYMHNIIRKSRKILFTNGLLLTKKNAEKLIRYLDHLVVDVYLENEEDGLPANIEEVKSLGIENIHIIKRRKNEVLSSRGGNAPNKELKGENPQINTFCPLLFSQLVIRPDGGVSLCCNDVYGDVTLGNVNEKTIREIWENPMRKELQKKMISEGRRCHNLCSKCDTVHSLKYYYYSLKAMEEDKIKELKYM